MPKRYNNYIEVDIYDEAREFDKKFKVLVAERLEKAP